MRPAVLTLILISFCLSTWAQNPQFEWARSMGGAEVENFVSTDVSHSVTTDTYGSIYTAGEFIGEADFDPGPDSTILDAGGARHIFVQKLDAEGNLLWAISMGNSVLISAAYAITTDEDGNVYVTGYFQGTVDFDPGPDVANLVALISWDIFVLKLDTNGNYLWAKAIGGVAFESGRAISVDTEKNVYISGFYRSTVDFDPGPGTAYMSSNGYDDVFVLKLNEDGNYQWATSLGGTGYDYGRGITNDNLGNVYITGFHTFDIDFDPGPDSLFLGNQNGLFIQKLDTNGNLIWAKSIESYDSTERAIAIDESSNVYVTGLLTNDVDFDPGPDSTILMSGSTFTLKLDVYGNFLWAKSIEIYDRTYSIAIDEQNNVYTLGAFSETTDFDTDTSTFLVTPTDGQNTFIQKLDTNGNFVWAGAIGGTGRGIYIDSSCNIVITGDYSSTTDFDPNEGVSNLTENGTTEIYVVKLRGGCDGSVPISSPEDTPTISFFPNPNFGKFEISGITQGTYQIYDTKGRTIQSGELENDASIDISQESQGVYFISFFVDNQIYTKKIIKI